MTASQRTRLLTMFASSWNGIGGQGKADMLSGDLIARRIGLKQKSLSAVLKFIHSGFGCRYGSRWYDELEMRNKNAAMAEVGYLCSWHFSLV